MNRTIEALVLLAPPPLISLHIGNKVGKLFSKKLRAKAPTLYPKPITLHPLKIRFVTSLPSGSLIPEPNSRCSQQEPPSADCLVPSPVGLQHNNRTERASGGSPDGDHSEQKIGRNFLSPLYHIKR